MDSILTSIKKLLGIPEEYTAFDADLLIHINSVLAILTQMGIGPSNGFTIADSYAKWSDFIPDNNLTLESVKSYIYLKVKILFDPPDRTNVLESTNRMIRELEWRLYVEAEALKEKNNDI